MEHKKIYIGIDLGGTKTKIGFIDENGIVLASSKIPTPSESKDSIENVYKIADLVSEMIVEHGYQGSISSIGIGVPGTVDREQGTILFAPNLGWKNVSVKGVFEDRIKVPVYLGQDTEAAVLGEYLYGAGRGLHDLACITIGTGVGCGIIINGKIHKGKFATAGELGHTIVEKEGLLCNCGKRGCLEAYSSGTAILKGFQRAIHDGRKSSLLNLMDIDSIRTENIFWAAKKGDNLSLDMIGSAIDYLSIAITNLINIICPQAVIISGGIGTEREFFVQPLIKKVNSRIYGLLKNKVEIIPAELNENAPLIGASMLFRDRLFCYPKC